MADKNKGGRPWLTDEQKTRRKEYLVQKLEPYLKIGLSVNKALKEAQIANSEFYKYLSEDRLFGEKIQGHRNFISVLVSAALVNHLMDIVSKQTERTEGLSKQDVNFLCWFATHSNHTTEEYGRRVRNSSLDADEEIQKVYGLL